MGMNYSKIFEFLRSAKGSWIYGLFSKWYVLVAIPAVLVTYNVLKALSDNGVLGSMYKTVENVLSNLVRLSITCPSKITHLDAFFHCLGS